MKPNETGRGYAPAPKDSTGSFNRSRNKTPGNNRGVTASSSAPDPSEIVPDGFDADRLDELRNQTSTTPSEERPKCPECKALKVHRKSERPARRKYPEDWRCNVCDHHFDEPHRDKPASSGVSSR